MSPTPVDNLPPSKDVEDGNDDSVASGSDGQSSTDNSSTTNNNKKSQVAPALAQREDALVTRSKIVVFLVLCLATALVATMTYRYTKNEEEKDFRIRVSGCFVGSLLCLLETKNTDLTVV